MSKDEKDVFEVLDRDEINDFRQPGYEVFGDVKNNSELKNTDLRVPKEKVTYEQIDDDFIT